jgi:flavin reductase (DIM6/NTAB) family NADH-FMN oxidoreductase RutF
MRSPTPAAGHDAAAAIDPHLLRHALGRFASGVTIVTTLAADGAPVGLTVNSFSSLSLDPPLVLWSLRRHSGSLAVFSAAPRFAVNVLAEAQVDVSRQFAARGRHAFDARWRPGEHGLPLLTDAAATFVCETTAQHTAGDHQLFIGQVLALSESHAPPLVFHGGRYRRLGEPLA